MLLQKVFLKLMQHDLEALHFLHVELGHILLELSLFMINFLLQFNNALGNGKF